VTYAEHGAALAEGTPRLTDEQVTQAARIYAAELAVVQTTAA
jgi:hypothetical protein